MTATIRALVLDDEPIFHAVLSRMLEATVPGIEVETRTDPDPSGEFDIYFIDNEFDQVHRAASLAEEIRRDHPNELVLAFSGTLNTDVLKGLINAGCNGVCDKSNPEDLPMAMTIVKEFVEGMEAAEAVAAQQAEQVEQSGAVRDKGIFGAIRSISELLREWNQRLDSQEASLRQRPE